MTTPSEDVVVVLALDQPPEEPVRAAVAECSRSHRRLRLQCMVPRASRWVALAGVEPASLERAMAQQAAALLRRVLQNVPDDLPTTTQILFAR